MKTPAKFSVLLQAFFTDYLITQRQVSQHTIESYRDTFRLFLQFTKNKLKKEPSALNLDDITVTEVLSFLKYLEVERKVSARTRNQRLAAIHSCYHYAAFYYPERSDAIQQILAIPQKKHCFPSIDFLTSVEIESLLAAPDTTTWSGRRDYTLILLDIRTGLRVSELINLRRPDIFLGSGAHVRCFGKGRKERSTPITKKTATALKSWLLECKQNRNDRVFTNARGNQFSRDGIRYILNKHIVTASKTCASLKKKQISPHVLRHTTAMQLIQSGVDPMIIALWLGHESVETTQIYVKADLRMKENALKKTKDPKSKPLRYKPDDELLAFLQAL